MDVTPQELRGSEIKEAWRGYHRDEVDELLERAAGTIEGLNQQLATVSSRPPDQSALPVNRDDAEMLQRTLLLAQRAADDAVSDAQAQARKLIEESEARAQALVGEAEASARRIAESERRRLESEIQDLATRRDALRSDADALEAYASAYRDRVRAAIEADLAHLGSGAIDAPMPRPELREVPELREEPVAAAPVSDWATDVVPETQPERGGAGDARGPDTRAVTIDAPSAAAAAVAAEPHSSPIAAPPRPAETAWPPPAAPEAGSAPGASASSTWLAGGDDWSPSDPAFEEALPWEQPTGQHEPFASEVPMEAHPVDGDALDDDAFFASLRDAVREEQPLGPRDDEPSPFFDDQVTDDRRRFRRRR